MARAALTLIRVTAILVFTIAAAERAAAEQPVRLQTLKAHDALVRFVKFAPNGARFLTAGFDGRVRLFDAATSTLQTEMQVEGVQFYWCDFLSDDAGIATGGSDGIIRLWSPDTGAMTLLTERHTAAAWTGVSARDHDVLASGGPAREFWIWDMAEQPTPRKFGLSAEVWWLALSPDESQLAVADGDGKISLFRMADGEPTATLEGHTGGVHAVDYSPMGNLLASASRDQTLRLWNLASNQAQPPLPHFGQVLSVAFSPDGDVVATGANDYTVRLWDVAESRFLEKLTGPRDAVWCLDFAPDGNTLLAACADGNVYRWTGLTRDASPPAPLPSAVDLRQRFARWKLRVVGQHTRGTCSVHTFARAMEFAASRGANRSTRLSDEYLNWACNQVIGNVGPGAVDRGQFFEHLWMGWLRHGVCLATEMPLTEDFDPQLSPTVAAQRRAAAWDREAFAWHDLSGPGVASEEVVRRVKAVLAEGWPVLAGSTHSLLIVGYRDDPQLPGGGCFVVADSGAAGGSGDFIAAPTSDPLHSAITYARIDQYGCSWIEYVDDAAE